MQRLKRQLCAIIVTTLLCLIGQSAALSEQNEVLLKFPVSEWNAQLDKQEEQGKLELNSIDKLEENIDAVDALIENAKKCIKHTKGEINKIQEALSGSNISTVESAVTPGQPANQAATAEKSRVKLESTQTDCKLFLLRANDVSEYLQKKQDAMAASLLISQKTSLIGEIKNLYSGNVSFQDTYSSFSSIEFSKNIPGNIFLVAFLPGLIFVVLFTFWIKSLCKNLLFHNHNLRIVGSFCSSLLNSLFYLTISLYFIAYFSIISLVESNINIWLEVSVVFFSYYMAVFLVSFIFYPPYPANSLVPMPGSIPRIFSHRLNILFKLIALSAITYIVSTKIIFPVEVVDIATTLFLSLVSISMISILWVVTRVPKLFYEWKFLRYLLNIFFSSLLLVIIFSQCLGFHNLSAFLIKNLAISIILIFSAWTIQIILKRANFYLENNVNFRKTFGVRFNETIYELSIIRYTLNALIWMAVSVYILYIWVVSELFMDEVIAKFVEGFTVSSLTIIPARIFTAVIVFCVLSIFSRWIQNRVSQQSRAYKEEGRQVAIGTIAGYAAYVLSFLIALIIAGINFTGLAIIAGALSVGIGFGLQNIANDFISGIILLIETPIKPGDRVNVGDIEGFVRRIRLRSTQIKSLHQSDIFVPNSELISKQVTNYMFSNEYWRVSCRVGVSYDSDVEKVRDILLKVGNKHPDVVKEGKDKPYVLFSEFGESALLFKLYCVIGDVNKKYHVESELHYAVYQAFKENGIIIPFPQQDLHIKEWPETPTKPE